MAARTIVTFHPDVACDVCGRRLLRGERPDVFLGGGQRRMVCELCTPRATHEGWRREVEEQLANPRPQRPQRGRSLLGRLRQLREPAPVAERGAAARGTSQAEIGYEPDAEVAANPAAEWSEIEPPWSGIDEEWAGISGAESQTAEHTTELEPTAGEPAAEDLPQALSSAADADVRRALEVFNVGESPRRVAGVARSLGAASVKATPVLGAPSRIAILVAWELCWYRYEIDLGDEAAGAQIVAEGMELDELAPEDRAANASADERGELSLLAG
ncbi:MAG TPA: hypothetical protein VGL57_08555 [Solirubrobacteraceae bacterium]|jgi:hypothetical protein